MEGFIDEYLPDRIRGFPFMSSPRTSTTIAVAGGGTEQRNGNWAQPLHRFSAPEIIKCHDDIEDLRDHWMVTDGPLLSFPFRDPMDFASRRLVKPNLPPTLDATDQILGIGDGATTIFRLLKKYTRGSHTKTRYITLPVVSTLLVAVNAVPTVAYTVDREAGEITMTSPPAAAAVVTAGFLFDVPARFEGDDVFDQVMRAWQVDGAAGISFVEIRPC